MNLKQIVISSILIFSSVLSNAQKINIANFYLNQDNKEVLLSWTIDAGPTCNGITVWHSIDSVNYSEVGNIAGVCGSTSSSIPYNFKHESPVINKTNYYKLRLGYSQFSEVRFLHLEFIEAGKIVIKPNPSTDNVSIAFNNDKNETFSLTIINSAGLKIFESTGIRENTISINTSSFDNGNYYILLMDSGGRIIKEKLLISK